MTHTDEQTWLATFGAADADAAWLLCDRHDPDAIAFTLVEADLAGRDLSFGELANRSRRMAAVLAAHGVQAGDRVAVLMGKRIELVVTLMAIWRLGAVHVPLFTAFAAPAVEMRVEASSVGVIVTEPAQRAKLDGLDGRAVLEAGPRLDAELDAAEPIAGRVAVGGDGQLVELYTSGTTGHPKAVPVPVRALAAFSSYMVFGLDVTGADVFWNAADPGWAYGLYYGVLGPLAIGGRNLLLDAGFSVETTYAVLERFGVTNFAAAPTVYRALSRATTAPTVRLRRASSAGEPLTPDVVTWGKDALDVEIRDHYGQTEQGMVIVNGWHDEVRAPVRPGSMGRALPGFRAAVVDGQIALATDSPLMWFTGYVDAPERTAERFTTDDAWYLTADIGKVDADGYFFFTSRDDDVILAAGYRIGPVDVESVLATHPLIADVAVVGASDEVRGQIVVAHVVLVDGATAPDELVTELQDMVRSRYSAHAYPRQVHVVDSLPRTPSGKVQRYLLR